MCVCVCVVFAEEAKESDCLTCVVCVCMCCVRGGGQRIRLSDVCGVCVCVVFTEEAKESDCFAQSWLATSTSAALPNGSAARVEDFCQQKVPLCKQ